MFSVFSPRFWFATALLLFCSSAQAQPAENPPHLETGRYGMPSVAVGTAIYVVGGGGPSGLRRDVERIETGAGELAVSTLRPPILPRRFHTAESDGAFIYIMGGETDDPEERGLTRRFERLDTRDLSIKLLAPLPEGLRVPASAIAEGKIYVAGGSDEFGDETDSFFIYEIAADTWTRGAPMLEKKECELLRFGNTLLAVGGFDGKVAVRGVQSYDIEKNQWRELPPLPIKTSAHHGAVVGPNVVLFGDYEERGRVQIGDPALGNWTRLDRTGFNPRRHNAVIGLGENIYVIGGNIASSRSFYNDIQVFQAKNLTP